MDVLILLAGLLFGNVDKVSTPRHSPPRRVVRFATFNASLSREKPGDPIRDLASPENAQARNLAEIIRRTRPDVLLVNESDFDRKYLGPALFQPNYLALGLEGAEPIDFPPRCSSPVIISVASGQELNSQAATQPGSRVLGDDTGDPDGRSYSNPRADSLLPSKGLKPLVVGVFRPEASDPLARPVQMSPAVASSDHRLVDPDLAID